MGRLRATEHRPAASTARPATPPPTDARDAACRALARHAKMFPDVAPTLVDDQSLDGRDAALAHAIADAAIRRWGTLRYLIAQVLDQPFDHTEPRLRAVLLAGAAQLLLLDRLPAHAVINESVRWAKRHIREGAGGLVNAVLRRLAAMRPAPAEPDAPAPLRATFTDQRDELLRHDGLAVPLVEPLLPADPWERLAVQTSVTRTAIDQWRSAHGDDQARSIALHSLVHPPTVLNIAHAPALAQHPDLTPHDQPGAAVFTGAAGSLGQLLTQHHAWAQDASSQHAITFAAEHVAAHIPQGSPTGHAPDSMPVIVDLCAGRGTKTRQLLAEFPGAHVFATDTDPQRFAELRALLDNHPRARVLDDHALPPRVAGLAQLVLLDVPCSNSGVLARRPEARHRLLPPITARLIQTQHQILAAARPMLAPGGFVLYSTCSIDPAENGEIVDHAVATLGLTLVAARILLPRGTPGGPTSLYRDGAFVALLRAPGA